MYDAIVVGARAAGSPAAMLLARRGYRVLLVDRATFPSDTLSTHIIHAPGIAALARWSLLDQVIASGCPSIDSYTFDFGPLAIRGTSRPVEGNSSAYAPRRTVLDAILVEAAARAGAEVRQGYNVDDLVVEEGVVVGIRRAGAVERARIVIGADGRGSHVATRVQSERYNTKPKLQYSYYTYFSNLPVDGQENHIRPHRGFGCAHTNDGLTMIVAGWPYAQVRQYKSDVETNYLATLRMVPSMADRLGRAGRHPRGTGPTRAPGGAGGAMWGPAAGGAGSW
jgi:flavin-dependent dehydrogenase